MYTILIALGVGIVAGGVWTLLGLWKTWAFGIVLGITVFLVSFIVLSRRLTKRIEPAFQQVQRNIEAGNPKLGLKGLEAMLPMANWQILLKGQLEAQMGSLCFMMGDYERALGHLEKASPRVPDSQLFLASIHYKRKNVDGAKKALERCISYNKKQMLPYNVYAWLLAKEGDRDGAIEQLLKALKIEKSNESTKENLNRLQNGKKLNMKRFGMQWFGLGFEKVPASMRQPSMSGRRGMRRKSVRGR